MPYPEPTRRRFGSHTAGRRPPSDVLLEKRVIRATEEEASRPGSPTAQKMLQRRETYVLLSEAPRAWFSPKNDESDRGSDTSASARSAARWARCPCA